jgi:hypothetical protein
MQIVGSYKMHEFCNHINKNIKKTHQKKRKKKENLNLN